MQAPAAILSPKNPGPKITQQLKTSPSQSNFQSEKKKVGVLSEQRARMLGHQDTQQGYLPQESGGNVPKSQSRKDLNHNKSQRNPRNEQSPNQEEKIGPD